MKQRPDLGTSDRFDRSQSRVADRLDQAVPPRCGPTGRYAARTREVFGQS